MPQTLRLLVLGLIVGPLARPGLAQEHEQAASKPASPAPADVRDLGAVGDGQADDTAALERALAGGGLVSLPSGTFRITRTIVVDLDKRGPTAIEGHGVARILMAASGPALKFIGTHEGSADPASFKPGVLERQRMPMVDGLEIVGAHAGAIGIEATGVMELTVTRTRITECLHGIRLSKRNRNIIISDCHIYKNRGIGVYYDQVDLHQSNIIGSHISYCAGGGVVTRGGAVRNLHIGTSDIESNQDPRGEPTANVLIDSTSSPSGTAEVAITGCTIQHNSRSPDSANIRILGKGAAGGARGVANWGHVTITGNVLSDVDTNIHLKGCRDVTITGNTFWVAYKHNLQVEDCIGLVAGSNVMGRNPAYSHNESRASAENAVVFRNSRDCTISGLEVHAVRNAEAGVLLENCDRFNINGCTILDCERAGLLARNLTRSRISDCMIRDDRDVETRAASLVIEGGKDLQVVDNMLTQPSRIPASVLPAN